MKLILTLISSLLVFQSIAQTNFTPVDRKEVEKLISDSSAATHYPKLIKRLETYDTTLTADDYRLIYYGAVFQPGYTPYTDNKTEEIKKAFEKEKYADIVKYCDEVIAKNPVTLRNYYYKLIALSNMKDSEILLGKTRFQYSRFLDAIVSTGDGIKCSTAFKVICVSDEYDVMYRYFEIEKIKSQSLQTPCDNMSISQSKYFPHENMFFDVSESFRAMEKMFNK